VWRELGTTILMVTHSVEEAVFLSQRLYVMSPRPGCIAAQLDVPFGPDRSHALMRDAAFQHLCPGVDDLLCEPPPATTTHPGRSVHPL
jgi:NitT/TauT family transport system ATP-binding protein